MNTVIFRVLIHYCAIFHVDPLLVRSVITVESGWNADLIGQANEQGLMQLLPTSFPKYSKQELKDVNINLREGISYLSKMKKECKYKLDNTWVVCYNRGSGADHINPYTDTYYKNVMLTLKKLRKEEDAKRKTLAVQNRE